MGDERSGSGTRLRRGRAALVGQVLADKYRIVSVMQSGGMGTVYRAEQLALEREVAVKVADKLDKASCKRFLREAKNLAKIQHPNILTVFDYGTMGEDESGLFMVMELLKGQTLRDRLGEGGPLSSVQVLGIAHQIARALRVAHRQKLVHRDLKPSNIMLIPQDDGTELVKILDFGIVKILDEDVTEVTQAGSLVGSPHYMAPELITGLDFDHRADIYALGVIMFQALTGSLPFDEERIVETLRAHVGKPPPDMMSVNRDVDIPEALNALVSLCLAKSPDDRPADMDAFGRALVACEWEMDMVPALSTLGHSENDSELPSTSTAPRVRTPSSKPSDSTPHALAQPDLPPSSAPSANSLRQNKSWPWVLAIVAAASVTGMTGWMARTVSEGEADVVSFTLDIESIPGGAKVRKNGELVGVSPLRLTLDNEELGESPAKLALELNGRQSVEIVQGPSTKAVRLVVTLPAPVPSR
jgi:eukaryotic-like serine/threonine-protein kinase